MYLIKRTISDWSVSLQTNGCVIAYKIDRGRQVFSKHAISKRYLVCLRKSIVIKPENVKAGL